MGEIAENDPTGKAVGRMLVKVFTVGSIAGLAGLGSSGGQAAVGAFLGVLAAGLYCVGYLRSHVNRQQYEHTFDRKVARQAGLRLMVIVLGGFGVFAYLDKEALKAYLLAFIVGFPVLLVTEAPRVVKQLKARGMIG